MWSCKITWKTKIIVFISTMSMFINFGRVGIYNEELLSTKSLDPLIMCLASVSLPQGLCSLNLAKWWLTLRNLNTLSHTTLGTFCHAISRDKLKTFYLQYHNNYGHQTWQGGYIQEGVFHEVTIFRYRTQTLTQTYTNASANILFLTEMLRISILILTVLGQNSQLLMFYTKKHSLQIIKPNVT